MCARCIRNYPLSSLFIATVSSLSNGLGFSMLAMLSNPFSSYLLLYALLPSSFASSQFAVRANSCKAVPGSPSWPPDAEWSALNASISGQLLKPLPPAAVCDTSLSVFNKASCSYVASQYNSSSFHAQDPVSVDQTNFENDACLPSPEYHCNLQQFPNYVVNATKAEHVQAAVNFARARQVRLIVKGTGHDYLGR